MGNIVASLLPICGVVLLLCYFTHPYKRDRMTAKCSILITILEMVYYYCEGYSWVFFISHFVSIILTVVMEEYVSRYWSIEKYAKYRLEYCAFHTFVLYLSTFSIRPWAVRHYGKAEIANLPIVTMMFAPFSQRMFAQNLPVLIGVKKGPVSFSWFPNLVFFALVLSVATALSIGSLNIYTVSQLWPYYVSPYFIAFSAATGIKLLRIPTILRCVADDSSQLQGWYF